MCPSGLISRHRRSHSSMMCIPFKTFFLSRKHDGWCWCLDCCCCSFFCCFRVYWLSLSIQLLAFYLVDINYIARQQGIKIVNLKCSLINREMAGESRGWERSGGDGNRFNFHMSSHDSGQKQITNIRRCKKKTFNTFWCVWSSDGEHDTRGKWIMLMTTFLQLRLRVKHSSLAWHASMKNKSSKQFALSIFRTECFAAIFGHCTIAAIRKHIECSFASRCSVCNYKLIIRQSHVFRVIWKWLKMYRARATHCFGNNELSQWNYIQSHVNCVMEFNRKGISGKKT